MTRRSDGSPSIDLAWFSREGLEARYPEFLYRAVRVVHTDFYGFQVPVHGVSAFGAAAFVSPSPDGFEVGLFDFHDEDFVERVTFSVESEAMSAFRSLLARHGVTA